MSVTGKYLKRIKQLNKEEFIQYIVDNFAKYEYQEGFKGDGLIIDNEKQKKEYIKCKNFLSYVDDLHLWTPHLSKFDAAISAEEYSNLIKKHVAFILDIRRHCPERIVTLSMDPTNPVVSEIDNENRSFPEDFEFCVSECKLLIKLFDSITPQGEKTISPLLKIKPDNVSLETVALAHTCQFVLDCLFMWVRLHSPENSDPNIYIFDKNQMNLVHEICSLKGQLLRYYDPNIEKLRKLSTTEKKKSEVQIDTDARNRKIRAYAIEQLLIDRNKKKKSDRNHSKDLFKKINKYSTEKSLKSEFPKSNKTIYPKTADALYQIIIDFNTGKLRRDGSYKEI